MLDDGCVSVCVYLVHCEMCIQTLLMINVACIGDDDDDDDGNDDDDGEDDEDAVGMCFRKPKEK